MRVLIRGAAYDDLDRIYAWIAKDRPSSADAVIDRILESAERLGRFPFMGQGGLRHLAPKLTYPTNGNYGCRLSRVVTVRPRIS
jgi:plasmid stabilization system protein ParE